MKTVLLLSLIMLAVGSVFGFFLSFPLSSAMLSRLEPVMSNPANAGHQQLIASARFHYAEHLALYMGLLFATAPLAVIANGSKSFKIRYLWFYLFCGLAVTAVCYWLDFAELNSPTFEVWGGLTESALLTSTRHPLNGILVVFAVCLFQRFFFRAQS